MMAAAERAGTPEDRSLYLEGVAAFRDPAIVARALQYSLTPKLRSQDAARYFANFLQEDVARPLAWTFLKEHWTELRPKVVIAGGDVTLIGALSAFCDAASREDVRTFFSAHPLPAAARTLDQTLERIDSCIEISARETPVVTRWLDSRQ
jgi:aminopeptidase N/puromycin-sensitive aminopeptidase